jgi:hypothetical protein
MEKKATERILDTLTRHGKIDQILFTGHSAGGAVAQLLYAMSMSAGSAMHDLVSGQHKNFSNFVVLVLKLQQDSSKFTVLLSARRLLLIRPFLHISSNPTPCQNHCFSQS